jgi:CrcB protein
MIYLWVALGSAIGGAMRYWCSGVAAVVLGPTFPWGTLIVNVVGSLVIGLFAAMTGPDGRLIVAGEIRQFVMSGILGGFTTFSSFSLQTLILLQEGEWLYAGVNILASVTLCLVVVWLGYVLGQSING